MKNFIRIPRQKRNAETWQVVYIDLMTNLMIFFVILWAINQSQPVKLSEKTGDQTSRMVNLPGDVLFFPGKTFLTGDGKAVFKKLFSSSETGEVLNFSGNDFSKRFLVIHGHTDGDGEKDKNFELGFQRAFAAYEEIRLHSKEIPDHVVLCSHADNSTLQDVPMLTGILTDAQQNALRSIKAKNRRITIEDRLESRVQTE